MHLVEKHIISRSHPSFKELDDTARSAAKTSSMRLSMQFGRSSSSTSATSTITKSAAYSRSKDQPDFRALPAKVSWQILTQIHEAFQSFFELLKLKAAGQYDKPVKLPQYFKNKTGGRNLLTFCNQAILRRPEGFQLSGTSIIVSTKRKCEYDPQWKEKLSAEDAAKLEAGELKKPRLYGVKEIRVVPRLAQDCYVLEVVYEVKDKELLPDNGRHASIDLGVRVLAAVIFNTGDRPELISGRPLLDTNAFWQKETAKLKSTIAKGDKEKEEYASSKRIRRMNRKRQNKVNDYLHRTTRYIANQAASKEISKVFVGHNKEWKRRGEYGEAEQSAVCLAAAFKVRRYAALQVEAAWDRTHCRHRRNTQASAPSSIWSRSERRKMESMLAAETGDYSLRLRERKFHADVCGAGNTMRKATAERGLERSSSKSQQAAEDAAVRPVRISREKLTKLKSGSLAA